MRLVIDVDLFFLLDFVDDSLNLFDDLAQLGKINCGFGFFLSLLIDLEADAVDFVEDRG